MLRCHKNSVTEVIFMGCVNFGKYNAHLSAAEYVDKYCKKFHHDKSILIEAIKNTAVYQEMINSGMQELDIVKNALPVLDSMKMTDGIYASQQYAQKQH